MTRSSSSSLLLQIADSTVSNVPRVSQIKQAIRGHIHSGKLKTGEKLPSLTQIASMFDCSLGLVRQATNTLVAEGLLTSQPRKGVFVSESRAIVSDIVLVAPTSHVENIQRIFEGIRIGFEHSSYRVVLHAANFDFEQQMKMLEGLDPQSYAGALVLPPPFIDQASCLIKLKQQGVPVVQVGRSLIGLEIDAVIADGMEQGRMAMEYLLAQGHRRIGYVSNQADYYFNRELVQGFELAFKSVGLLMNDVPVAYVNPADLNGEQPWLNGMEAAAGLLQKHPNLTSIIGITPHLTLGVYKAVQKSGKVVGRDISVMGLFADLSFFTALEPTATVVCCDLHQMGQRAALLLRQRIENPEIPHRTICLSPKLVSRDSVCTVS